MRGPESCFPVFWDMWSETHIKKHVDPSWGGRIHMGDLASKVLSLSNHIFQYKREINRERLSRHHWGKMKRNKLPAGHKKLESEMSRMLCGASSLTIGDQTKNINLLHSSRGVGRRQCDRTPRDNQSQQRLCRKDSILIESKTETHRMLVTNKKGRQDWLNWAEITWKNSHLRNQNGTKLTYKCVNSQPVIQYVGGKENSPTLVKRLLGKAF